MNTNVHGWKTYLAAVASILWGAKLVFVDGNVSEGMQFLLAGFALIGIRGAFSKLLEKGKF